MFTVFASEFPYRKLAVATVASHAEAAAFLAGKGDVIAFDADADHPGFADAAVFSFGSLDIYTVEPVRTHH